jgi:hypothetical protein
MFQQCKEAFPGLPVDVSGNLRQADLHPGGSWRSGPLTQWILGGPTLSAKRQHQRGRDHPPHGPTCCRLALQLQLQMRFGVSLMMSHVHPLASHLHHIRILGFASLFGPCAIAIISLYLPASALYPKLPGIIISSVPRLIPLPVCSAWPANCALRRLHLASCI